MNRWREAARAFWLARSERERMILIAAAIFLVPLLFWFVMIEPALQGRATWQKKLPALRAEEAQLQSLLAKLKTEPAAPAASAKKIPARPLSRQLLESTLAAKGIKATSLSVDDDQARLSLADARFSSLLVWLQEVHGSAQLDVTEASITSRQEADHIDATLRLHQVR